MSFMGFNVTDSANNFAKGFPYDVAFELFCSSISYALEWQPLHTMNKLIN